MGHREWCVVAGMIQCISDSNPYDDEPDVVEEAEKWLEHNKVTVWPDDADFIQEDTCNTAWARRVVEGLLGYIKDEI